MAITAGDCFHLSNDGVRHLWIVIAGPCGNPPCVFMVNLSSYQAGFDETVLLDDGHPFIKRTSRIRYDKAKFILVSDLEDIVAHRPEVCDETKMNADKVEVIVQGMYKTKFLKREVKEAWLYHFPEKS